MLNIEGWAIDADERCYIVGRLKTRTTKDGNTERYIHNPRYFTRLSDALNGILESEKRRVVQDKDLTIGELLAAVQEIDRRFTVRFKEMEGVRYE